MVRLLREHVSDYFSCGDECDARDFVGGKIAVCGLKIRAFAKSHVIGFIPAGSMIADRQL